MNTRRYIGALIIVLTFLGVVYQQQNTIPNQEIVLQFTDANLASDEAQNTIAIVTEQLQEIGVDNIQVKEGEDGILKITYFSHTDVDSVKNKLSTENGLVLNYNVDNQNKSNHSPDKENSIGYNLDVFEIYKGNETDWDLTANSVIEHKAESDRYFNPNVYFSALELSSSENELCYNVALKTQRNIAIAIDNISYIIPEVRAGPTS